MKTVNSSVEPTRSARQSRLAKWWAAAHRQDQANLDAATVIFGDISRVGGESAGPVIWARMVLRREDELQRGATG